MRRLYIIGAGGHARVVREAAEQGGWECVMIAPDDASGSACDVGSEAAFLALVSESAPRPLICGVGSIGTMHIRNAVLARYAEAAEDFVTLVHPTAMVAPSARLGRGVFVSAGAIVQSGAEIMDHAIINTGSIVEHDCRVGRNTHVASGALIAGGARIGDDTLLGCGARIIQGVSIGRGVVVGAGAVCIRDVADDSGIWIGVPARPKNSRRRLV